VRVAEASVREHPRVAHEKDQDQIIEIYRFSIHKAGGSRAAKGNRLRFPAWARRPVVLFWGANADYMFLVRSCQALATRDLVGRGVAVAEGSRPRTVYGWPMRNWLDLPPPIDLVPRTSACHERDLWCRRRCLSAGRAGGTRPAMQCRGPRAAPYRKLSIPRNRASRPRSAASTCRCAQILCGGNGDAATASTRCQPLLYRGRNLSGYAFISWKRNRDVVH